MRLALVALAMLVVTGCQQQPQQPQQASDPAAKEQSEMRTAVPLVRRLDPNETGPIELEFDVPAQPDDDAPPVFIGVRVTGDDSTAVFDAADRLRRADISAEVRLYRVQESGPVEVGLQRSQRVGRGEEEPVALSADGLAPRLFAFNADFSTMQAAGLLSEGAAYRELAFAYTPSIPAGRYRVAIRFGQNREALRAEEAELLVAYTAKGK
ncbi:hypothetical protein CSC74_08160 [Pseudoxanthomonas yeongjuensis]|nr:hypothetical protein CSC74_08160 [Pseudoxanthomonas yeongjuensis]